MMIKNDVDMTDRQTDRHVVFGEIIRPLASPSNKLFGRSKCDDHQQFNVIVFAT